MKFSISVPAIFQILITFVCLTSEAVDCSKFPIEIKTAHPGSTIATDQQVRLTLTSAEIECVKKTISGVRDYQSLFKCPDESRLISSTPVESISGERRGQVQLSVYCKSSLSQIPTKKNINTNPKNDLSEPPILSQPAKQLAPATSSGAR